MHNASVHWHYGRGRGMQKQWPHQHGGAAWGRARYRRPLTPPFGNLPRRQPAGLVRAGDDLQRAICGVTDVKVQPHREHSLQYRCWWLDVLNAIFDRPRGKSGNLDFFPNGDHEILVPCHFPICIRGFVEEQASHEERSRPENGFHQRPNRLTLGNLSDSWN